MAITRESMEIWLRVAARLAGRMRDGELTVQEQLELRARIDHALLLLVESRRAAGRGLPAGGKGRGGFIEEMDYR